MDTNLIKPYADLHGADLHGADLHGADLHGADLRGADLYVTILYGANLREAILCEADLRGANLREAILREADLRGTDLRGADLRGADLRGARYIASIENIGSRGDVLYFVQHTKGLMFKTGCFWGSASELLKQANCRHGIGSQYANEYKAAIQLAMVIAKGWQK